MVRCGCPVYPRPRRRRAACAPVRSPWPGPVPAGTTRRWRSPMALVLSRPGPSDGRRPTLPSRARTSRSLDHLANRRVLVLADRSVAGQPGAQRIRRIGLDADIPYKQPANVWLRQQARLRRCPGAATARCPAAARPGRTWSSAPCRPTRTTPSGRRRLGQDQQRPGPGSAPGRHRRGPVRGGPSGGPRPDRTTQARARGGRTRSTATVAMPVTSLPSWRADAARRSARPARRPLRRGWRGNASRGGADLATAVGVPGVGAGDGITEIPLDPRSKWCGYSNVYLCPGSPPRAGAARSAPIGGSYHPLQAISLLLAYRSNCPSAGACRSRPCSTRRPIRVGETGCQRTVSPFPAAGSGTGPGPDPGGAGPARRRGGLLLPGVPSLSYDVA